MRSIIQSIHFITFAVVLSIYKRLNRVCKKRLIEKYVSYCSSSDSEETNSTS
eukprot:SAG22_NODE_181_length_16048_cov_157.464418_10_plen_52_part_00